MLLAIVFIIICMMITLSVKHSQSVHVFLCVCACVFVCRIVFDTLSVQQRNERLFEWINVASIVGCVGRPCNSRRPDRNTENILKENISKVIAVVLSVVMSSSVPETKTSSRHTMNCASTTRCGSTMWCSARCPRPSTAARRILLPTQRCLVHVRSCRAALIWLRGSQGPVGSSTSISLVGAGTLR